MTNPTHQEFLKYVEHHQLAIVLDQDINHDAYRHIRCAKPGTSNQSYSITTWPGYLAYSGDMGNFMFHRRQCDMLAFFRKDDGPQINPGYWEEKLVATNNDGGHLKFSKQQLSDNCREYLNDVCEGMTPEKRAELNAAVKDEILGAESLEDARTRLRNFEFEGDSFFEHAWEWSLSDYAHHYIWACYAIVHAIGMYDEQKAQNETTNT